MLVVTTGKRFIILVPIVKEVVNILLLLLHCIFALLLLLEFFVVRLLGLELLFLLEHLQVLLIVFLIIRVVLFLALHECFDHLFVFLDVDVLDELVVFEADGAGLHLIRLQQIRRPGEIDPAVGLLAPLDTVRLRQLRAFLYQLLRQLVIRVDRLRCAQVHVRRGEVGNVEPYVVMLGVLDEELILMLVLTHIDDRGRIGNGSEVIYHD